MMRKWISLSSIAATIVVLSFCSNKPFNGEEPLLKRLVYTLNSQHYQPRKMDDKFSLLMYQNVLDRVDGDKQFFTVQDIKRFEVYKTSIDDQISAGRFDFFDTVWSVMMKRLDQIEPWVVADLSKPLNYQEKVSYEVKEKEEYWSKTDAELKEKWSKWSRFQTVDRLYRKMENDSTKSYDTLELKSRNETVKLVQDWFKRWRKMDRADQISFYGNTLAEIYDPHTNYFPPADKDNFDISMTGKVNVMAILKWSELFQVQRVISKVI
jgi:carboxyl-terminal processing protease